MTTSVGTVSWPRSLRNMSSSDGEVVQPTASEKLKQYQATLNQFLTDVEQDPSQLTSDQYWANVTKVEEMEDVLDQLIDVEGGTGLLGENLDIPGFVGERPITIGGEINSRIKRYNYTISGEARKRFDLLVATELGAPIDDWVSIMRESSDDAPSMNGDQVSVWEDRLLSTAASCGPVLADEYAVIKATTTVLDSECSGTIKRHWHEFKAYRRKYLNLVATVKEHARALNVTLAGFPTEKSEVAGVMKWLDGVNCQSTKNLPPAIDDVWERMDDGQWPPKDDSMSLADLFTAPDLRTGNP